MRKGQLNVLRTTRRPTPQEWDELCKEAVILREEGWLYKEIAQKFGYKSTSILCKQLKRRGLWKGKSRAESKEKWDKLCQQVAIKLF
ncbi:hypothetical protein PVK73_20775 [Bacillus thuringiensis]